MIDSNLRCACLLMQRNESELLEPWVRYHAALFGYENIFIFDNGSGNLKTKRLLREYEDLGVHVDRRFSTSEDYPSKGAILTDCIVQLNESGNYDFFFPLDCDEFLAIHKNGKVLCDSLSIKNYLTSIPFSETTYHVTKNYLNIIGHPEYYQEHPYSKVFFSKKLIVPLDHGSHLTSASVKVTPSDIVYIHCHAKPFATLLAHSRDKLRPWVDIDDPKALAAFENDQGIGWHLVKYLRMSETEYLNLFNTKGATYIPDFPKILKELGCSIDFLSGIKIERMTKPVDKIPSPRSLILNAKDHLDDDTIVLAISSLSSETDLLVSAFLRNLGFNCISINEPIEENHTVKSALQAGTWDILRKFSIAQTEKNHRLAITGFSSTELDLAQYLPIQGLRSVIVLKSLMSFLTGNPHVMASSARHLATQRIDQVATNLKSALSSSLEALILEEDFIQTDIQSFVEAFLVFLGQSFTEDTDTLVRQLQYTIAPSIRKDVSLYEGWIDTISGQLVSGWCWRKNSNISQIVGLVVNDHIVDVGIANNFREDLKNAGIGSGAFGYHLTLPENISPSSNRIQVRILNGNIPLDSFIEN
ncbi:glycosyltransferase family 2 protein [Gluconobacter morbifer]|uniref:Glycosyltransferase 2-like domain-containing protein n=1 Tax=Gluconobacter morbifer G707 TaxID=1088869 RepID=G6XGM3_9PROT|nr:glycosyltransferase family 2 protein [Gluconobacter morbifer]EHH69331.1 hypothetical protein GMO_06380 [Gluconobacter morbifer G707]